MFLNFAKAQTDGLTEPCTDLEDGSLPSGYTNQAYDSREWPGKVSLSGGRGSVAGYTPATPAVVDTGDVQISERPQAPAEAPNVSVVSVGGHSAPVPRPASVTQPIVTTDSNQVTQITLM